MEKNPKKVREVLNSVINEIILEKTEIEEIRDNANKLIEEITKAMKTMNIRASIFIGGSIAKGTAIRKELQDVDIFIRFNDKKDIELLEKIIKKTGRKYLIIHGSRDYLRIINGRVVYEIVPVLKIKNPKDAENVTDLSYYHVSYVVNEIKKIPKIAEEIALAKAYCKAQGVYGAESYVKGFSGYALELLIINYKTLDKMMKALIKINPDKEKLVIDQGRSYKNKQEVLREINEAKLESPIILVDPTYKSRNALAALSTETFKKFQESVRKFLNNPKAEEFVKKIITSEELMKEAKKKRSSYVKIIIKTDKQEGDIAGTKMLKFSKFLIEKLSYYQEIIRTEFSYEEGQESTLHIISKNIKERIITGPHKSKKKHLESFKKKHKNKVFMKGEKAYAKIKLDKNIKESLEIIKKTYNNNIKQMGITEIKIVKISH